MTARVYVWLGAWRRPDFWTGHSALSLDSGLYISYWPKKSRSSNSSSKKGSTFDWRAHRLNESINVDIEKLGQPDHTVVVMNLNESSMELFWFNVINEREENFHLLIHNCSTVVAKTLERGYLDSIKYRNFDKSFRKTPSDILSAMVAMGTMGTMGAMAMENTWYPSKVLRYATTLARVMN